MGGGEFEAEVAVIVGVGEDGAVEDLAGGFGELAIDDVVVDDFTLAEVDGGGEFFSGAGPGEHGEQLDVGDFLFVMIPDVQIGLPGGDFFDLELSGKQAEGVVYEHDVFGGEDEVLFLVLGDVPKVVFYVFGQVDAHFFYADFAEQFKPGLIDFDASAGEVFEGFDGLQADTFIAGRVKKNQSDGDEQQQEDGGGDFSAAPVMG